jgi:hypothetical protein
VSAPQVLLIPDAVWLMTLEVFASYAAAGVEAGCFWYGVRDEGKAFASIVGVPRQRNYPRYFEIDADDLAALTEIACAQDLIAVAQLHGHPGKDVNHSPWDDSCVVSRKVFSLVLPRYGTSPCPVGDIGVHRFERDRWNRLAATDAGAALRFLPGLVDMR